ncbi:hypothetical protein BC831DRAFT_453512 [Entophlyctis helioformis]|nr:hypothetical protein BC831DRAFT_453512 [Entophlyctis helioformis]
MRFGTVPTDGTLAHSKTSPIKRTPSASFHPYAAMPPSALSSPPPATPSSFSAGECPTTIIAQQQKQSAPRLPTTQSRRAQIERVPSMSSPSAAASMPKPSSKAYHVLGATPGVDGAPMLETVPYMCDSLEYMSRPLDRKISHSSRSFTSMSETGSRLTTTASSILTARPRGFGPARSGHMTMSSYSGILQPSESPLMNKPNWFDAIFGFIKKKQQGSASNDENAAYSSAPVQRSKLPLRFSPKVLPKTPEEAAAGYNPDEHEREHIIKEFLQDERMYIAALDRVVKNIGCAIERVPEAQGLQSLCDALINLKAATADMEQSINNIPTNFGIIHRIIPICGSYKYYVDHFVGYANDAGRLIESYPNIALELDTIQEDLLRPLQRIIDYRFYLQRLKRSKMTPSNDRWFGSVNDAINSEVNKVVADVYGLFNVKDTFDQVASFEATLDLSECKTVSIHLANSSNLYPLYTHLTMPTVSATGCQLAVSPTVVYEESLEHVEIGRKPTPIIKAIKNDLYLSSNIKTLPITVTILSDTIVLTQKVATQSGKEHVKLLYPPMLLSHIEVTYRAGIKGTTKMVDLKISPFVILFLIGTADKLKRLIVCIESYQKRNGTIKANVAVPKTKPAFASPGADAPHSPPPLSRTPTLQGSSARQAGISSLRPPRRPMAASTNPLQSNQSQIPLSDAAAVAPTTKLDGQANGEIQQTQASAARISARANLIAGRDVSEEQLVCLSATGKQVPFTSTVSNLATICAANTQPPKATKVFDDMCRPHLFKPDERVWERLARCHLRIHSTQSKGLLSLDMEGTQRTLLEAPLTPLTRCSILPTGRTLEMLVCNSLGQPAQYTLQLRSPKEAIQAHKAILAEILRTTSTTIASISDKLVLQPRCPFPPGLFSGDDDDDSGDLKSSDQRTGLSRPCFDVRYSSYQSQCLVRLSSNGGHGSTAEASGRGWTAVGPVHSQIIVSGPRLDDFGPDCPLIESDFGTLSELFTRNGNDDVDGVAYSTRLVISSAINSHMTLLEIELDGESISCRDTLDGTHMDIKVLVGSAMHEYQLDVGKDAVGRLRSSIAIETVTAKTRREYIGRLVSRICRARQDARMQAVLEERSKSTCASVKSPPSRPDTATCVALQEASCVIDMPFTDANCDPSTEKLEKHDHQPIEKVAAPASADSCDASCQDLEAEHRLSSTSGETAIDEQDEPLDESPAIPAFEQRALSPASSMPVCGRVSSIRNSFEGLGLSSSFPSSPVPSRKNSGCKSNGPSSARGSSAAGSSRSSISMPRDGLGPSVQSRRASIQEDHGKEEALAAAGKALEPASKTAWTTPAQTPMELTTKNAKPIKQPMASAKARASSAGPTKSASTASPQPMFDESKMRDLRRQLNALRTQRSTIHRENRALVDRLKTVLHATHLLRISESELKKSAMLHRKTSSSGTVAHM